MSVDEVLVGTFTDHEYLTPDATQVLQEIQRRTAAGRQSRRRMTVTAAITAAVIVAAIAVGVTRLMSAPASNPKPATTVTATAITTTPSRRADARQCTSTDVAAQFFGGNGAGGHSIDYVQFTNTSDTTCVLKGYPAVVIASQRGKPDVTATRGSFFSPMPSAANIAPGETTNLGIETDTYCADRPNGSGSSDDYQRLAITLPGGGTVSLGVHSPGLDLTCGLKLTTFWTN